MRAPMGIRGLIEAMARDATLAMDGRRSLVLAPHQDDEVLGCGGTIARKVRRGTPVSIAFLTDGRGGVAAAPDEARAVREAEAHGAAAALGLPPERLAFLRYEDGRLSDYVDSASEEIRRLVSDLGVEDVFVPYRREFHGDHMAAWRIGKASLPRHGRLYEYPIWYGPWQWRRLGGWSRLAAVGHLADAVGCVKVCVADVADAKRLALEAYRSRLAGFESNRDWGARFLENFSRRYELFFVGR